jgi:hypothetical protein
MTANYIRGNSFFLHDFRGVLTGLLAYLDGRGATTGSQQVRMVVYDTDRGAPVNPIAISDVVTIAAGTAPGWVRFRVDPTGLHGGSEYFLMLHTGDTGGVARDYGNGPGDWNGRADTFADGPDFGAVLSPHDSHSVTLSIYATYTLPSP